MSHKHGCSMGASQCHITPCHCVLCRALQDRASTSSSRVRLLGWLQQLGLSAFVLLYPYLHASVEAVKFVYQLGYLLDVFDTHSPLLHLLGQRLVRLTGQEMVSEQVLGP